MGNELMNAVETEPQRAFSEVWDLLMRLADKDGVVPLSKLVEPWHKLAGKWEFWVNGKNENWALKEGGRIPPFSVYIEYNGWPVGILNPNNGSIAAGAAANIFTFRDALKAEVHA